jgi:predicted Zn-dependent protease
MSLLVPQHRVRSRHFGLKQWVVAAACALVAGAAPPLALSQPLAGAGLPDLGDGSTLSTAQERRIGDRIMRDLYRDPAYLDDPVLMDYVQTLWQPLLQASRALGNLTPELEERYAWQLFLLRERTVNAFALPGGYMGLHLGLLAMVDSRDELTSVLAHEMGHVTQRHIARMLSKSSQQAPWMIGAMILGMLAASKNPNAGSALLMGGQAVGIQAQLNFSRDMEREADRIGLSVGTQAGYVPQGFVAMFDKLQQEARLNDSGDFPFLRTHPLTTERVADMQGRMPAGPVRRNPASLQLIDALMAARAKVLISPNAAMQQTWQALAESPDLASKPWTQRLATHYGAALAARQVHDVPRARQALSRLQAAFDQASRDQPDLVDVAVRQQLNWLDADIQLAARDLTPEAQARLATRLAEPPTQPVQLRRPALFLRAQLAEQIGTPEALRRAAQDMQGWLARHGSDALAWQTLSQLHEAQQLPLRALRDAAEAQMAMQHYDAALDRLRAAQDVMRQLGTKASAADQIDASIIDMRFRQVSAQLKAQALER